MSLHRKRKTALLAFGLMAGLGCHAWHEPQPMSAPPDSFRSAAKLPPTEADSIRRTSAQTEELPPPRDEGPVPINLPTALQLANAQNPEIALARERIREALAQQDRASLLWLPNLELGSTWVRHDGQIQRATGEVLNVSRSSLFVGGAPTLSLDLSEAFLAPLAARQITAAREAGSIGVTNDRLLDVALAYTDLLQTNVELRINDDTLKNARHLLQLMEGFERVGKVAPPDVARARTEVHMRERERQEILGRITVHSARLSQLLYFSPETPLRPVEAALIPLELIPKNLPQTELVAQALLNRPELTENRAIFEAAITRWRASRLAPIAPTLRVGAQLGAFGGGPNDFFGNFGGRSDVTAQAIWQLRSLGLGDLAIQRERQSQFSQAAWRQQAIQAAVASQVVAAYGLSSARRAEIDIAQRAVLAARESFTLNEDRIRRAPEQGRPIELLQAIQALARASLDYLNVVADYNRAQFRLYHAIGRPPLCALEEAREIETKITTTPPSAKERE